MTTAAVPQRSQSVQHSDQGGSSSSLSSILKTQLANGLFPTETLRILSARNANVSYLKDSAKKQGISDLTSEVQSLLVTLLVCLFVERNFTNSNEKLTWNLIIKKARSYVSKSASSLKLDFTTLQSIASSAL